MGSAATLFRAFFRRLKQRPCPYAYVSISGGALGPNPKLEKELTKRVGTAPAVLIDMHIADLLPTDKPTAQDTGSYRITDEGMASLAGMAVEKQKAAIADLCKEPASFGGLSDCR